MAQIGEWYKSSKSGPNCDNCVEVNIDGVVADGVAVRDTKDRGGPSLVFVPESFRAFVASAADGTLRASA